jgi:hypothetical protein
MNIYQEKDDRMYFVLKVIGSFCTIIFLLLASLYFLNIGLHINIYKEPSSIIVCIIAISACIIFIIAIITTLLNEYFEYQNCIRLI